MKYSPGLRGPHLNPTERPEGKSSQAPPCRFTRLIDQEPAMLRFNPPARPALRSRSRRDAFTLLELLIVLAILGIIAAMVAPNLIGTQKKAMIKATAGDIMNVESAAKRYAVDHDGEYPTADGLNLLVNPVDRDGKSLPPYLEKLPTDPWGTAYNYEYPTMKNKLKPAIWSSGPDKKNDNGANDDIKNWEG
jgi:general secretion pathway protein G